ncbi:hypothetical protein QQP08_005790, partial [Theobroma cacao]
MDRDLISGSLVKETQHSLPETSCLDSLSDEAEKILQNRKYGKKERVIWQWRDRVPWFYCPRTGKSFGTLWEMIGLACAVLQCIPTIINYSYIHRHGDGPIKTCALPILFAFGYWMVFRVVSRTESHLNEDAEVKEKHSSEEKWSKSMRVSAEREDSQRQEAESDSSRLKVCCYAPPHQSEWKELLGSGETQYLGFIVDQPTSLLVPCRKSSDLLVLSFNVLLQPSIIHLFLDILTALSKHLLCQSSLHS